MIKTTSKNNQTAVILQQGSKTRAPHRDWRLFFRNTKVAESISRLVMAQFRGFPNPLDRFILIRFHTIPGQWLNYNGIPVMPIYHPAFLLRNKLAKKDAWTDLQAVMTVFGRKPKPRK